MLDMEIYRPIIEFLSLFLGQDCEIVLCDKEKILILENPMDNSRYVGAPLDEVQKSFFNNTKIKDIPYTVNYRTSTKTGEKMRSATMFIRNDGELVGLLNINSNVTQLIQFRELIDIMIYGNQEYNVVDSKSKKKSKQKEYYETLSLSVAEMISTVVKEAIERFGAPPDRLTLDEKLSVIREMDKRGVFLAKGSVNEVADILGSSKATIYRYLQQIDK